MTSLRVFLALCCAALMLPTANADAQGHDKSRRRAPPARDDDRGSDPNDGRGRGHGKKGKGKDKSRRRAPAAPDAHWKVRKAPVITSFTPHSGPPQTVVTIHGRRFGRKTVVRFNGRTVRILSRARRMLQFRIPRRAVSGRIALSKRGFPDVVSAQTFNVVRAPRIFTFRPPRGNVGVMLKVRGENFLPSDQLLIGKRPLTIKRITPRLILATLPAGTMTAALAIRRGGRIVAQSRRPFAVALPQPLISGFSPASGEVGTVVRITGRYFDPRDSVLLPGQRPVIRSRGPNFIEVVIGRNRTGRFSIRGPGGRRAIAIRPFVVRGQPRVKAFTPRFGPPGTRLQVFGTHFLPTDRAYLGNRALIVRTITSTKIVAEIPNGTTTGLISVRRGARSFFARRPFAVLLPPRISSVSPRTGAPGTTVKIIGTGFTPQVAVMLSGRRLPLMRRTPTELWAKIPAAARTGAMVIVDRSGSVAAGNFTLTRYATVQSFFPLRGLPGTIVRVRGIHFTPRSKVYLGNIALPVRRFTPTQIWAVIPKTARTGRIAVQSLGRRVFSRQTFTVMQPPPELAFTVYPRVARRGSEVTLNVRPPRLDIVVYFNGRPLPKKLYAQGRRVVVVVPSNARSGYFEIEYRGRRYRSARPLRVR